jgi:hypothetical protein
MSTQYVPVVGKGDQLTDTFPEPRNRSERSAAKRRTRKLVLAEQ